MEKKYVTPSMEVIVFDCEDVITTSSDTIDGNED